MKSQAQNENTQTDHAVTLIRSEMPYTGTGHTRVTEQRWGGVMILLKALMCLLLTNAGEVGSVARGQTQLNDFQLKNF